MSLRRLPEGRSYIVSFNTFIERRKKMKAMRAVKRFFRDQKGTETVEWAIIIGLIAVGAIVVIGLIGGRVQALFEKLFKEMPAV